jgi:hypothetical protein
MLLQCAISDPIFTAIAVFAKSFLSTQNAQS